MSLSGATMSVFAESFPRVSGDEPSLVETVASKIGFSPRERG